MRKALAIHVKKKKKWKEKKKRCIAEYQDTSKVAAYTLVFFCIFSNEKRAAKIQGYYFASHL